jgi:hypothetical protein
MANLPVKTQPSEGFQLASDAYKLFPFWLAQQRLPEEPSRGALEDLLLSAFTAGYMRDHKE